jgi:hypothetical protein
MSRKMFYTVNKFEQGSYAYAEALIASFDTPRGAVDGRWQLRNRAAAALWCLTAPFSSMCCLIWLLRSTLLR